MKIKIINESEVDIKALKIIYDKLNCFDRERISKMNKSRQIKFLIGRYLLVQEGIDISKIFYNENGKPLIEDNYFSISHSFDLTAIAVSNKPIGIDIEKKRNINDKIKNNILKNFTQKDLIENHNLLFEEFTKREAYIKLNGLNLKYISDNISDYKFKTYNYKNYVVSVCYL